MLTKNYILPYEYQNIKVKKYKKSFLKDICHNFTVRLLFFSMKRHNRKYNYEIIHEMFFICKKGLFSLRNIRNENILPFTFYLFEQLMYCFFILPLVFCIVLFFVCLFYLSYFFCSSFLLFSIKRRKYNYFNCTLIVLKLHIVKYIYRFF